jgi:hypothetical protein
MVADASPCPCYCSPRPGLASPHRRGRIIPGRFDTALVNGNKGNVSFTNVLLY